MQALVSYRPADLFWKLLPSFSAPTPICPFLAVQCIVIVNSFFKIPTRLSFLTINSTQSERCLLILGSGEAYAGGVSSWEKWPGRAQWGTMGEVTDNHVLITNYSPGPKLAWSLKKLLICWGNKMFAIHCDEGPKVHRPNLRGTSGTRAECFPSWTEKWRQEPEGPVSCCIGKTGHFPPYLTQHGTLPWPRICFYFPTLSVSHSLWTPWAFFKDNLWESCNGTPSWHVLHGRASDSTG